MGLVVRKSDSAQIRSWAQEEFGHAQLGHAARNKRVVKMASRMAESPSGLMTQIFEVPAEREGAYRAVENPAIDSEALNVAASRAAARRARDHSMVYVPIDLTSLSLLSSPAENLSRVGPGDKVVPGLHVYNSTVLGDAGQMLGVGHQVWFERGPAPLQTPHHQRPFEQRESRYWLDAIEGFEQACEREEVKTTRCYVLDRGGDFHQMLNYAAHTDQCVILRSNADRRVSPNPDDFFIRRYMEAELDKLPILGEYDLDVTANSSRKARVARMEVHSSEFYFRLQDSYSGGIEAARLRAVRVREIGDPPPGEPRLMWRLITNMVVETLEDALRVANGYKLRWRIEEMHRCWKTVCGVEKTRLRSVEALKKFAVLMASVAARIEHIKTTSRTNPDAPATDLLSTAEIAAIKLLRQRHREVPPGTPSAQKAVQWLAQLGGYIGPSNGPPGAETIGRGLARLDDALYFLKLQGIEHHPPWPPEKSDQ